VDLKESKDGQQHLIVGKIENLTRKISKKSGNAYGIIKLLDFYSDIELMLFSKYLDELEKFNIEEPLAIKVKVQRDEQNFDIRVQELMNIEDAKDVKLRKYRSKKVIEEPIQQVVEYEDVYISFDIKTDPCLLESINDISTRGKGNKKITFIVEDRDKKYLIDTNLIVDDESLTKLKALDNIKIA
jgi:DNA polymerase-3 subunit alpha